MIERTFTYEGFDGKTYTDKWGFYLSRTDLLEITYGKLDGLESMMKRAAESGNAKEIMDFVKDLIFRSVGKVSPDGKRFIRNAEIREEFESSPAFTELYEELLTHVDKAQEFMIGAMPREMGEAAKAELMKAASKTTADTPAEAKAD